MYFSFSKIILNYYIILDEHIIDQVEPKFVFCTYRVILNIVDIILF